MSTRRERVFDVVVIGGGHAGCEAFAAACRIGASAALVTPDLAAVAVQPCNPAVGGPGKGHLVREVVALGGLMGRVTDRCGLQFRTLNLRKGPAVRSTRVQTEARAYPEAMRAELERIPGGLLIEDTALGLIVEGSDRSRRLRGLRLARGGEIRARAAVVTTGTFLRGMLFLGNERTPGGRRGAAPSVELAECLERLGMPLLRLKTGTCPRLAGDSVDFACLEEQPGDLPEPFFDPETRGTTLPQRPCHLTWTGAPCHDLIRANLGTSALFGGAITGIGPRYCPSIETKIARFPDRERHQIFLEPEDRHGSVIYPSGLSTSLPLPIQERMVRLIPGLERTRILRPGYAVEYDAIQPRCLSPGLEVDGIAGLFLAGQILGTSGYEEAAALGLVAGANAALAARGEPSVVLRRDQAYVGVMIDDLVTRGVDEPYRMFTSRAEHRLLLREDNAEERLVDAAAAAGLVSGERAAAIRSRRDRVERAAERLAGQFVGLGTASDEALARVGLPPLTRPARVADLLRRPGVRARDLAPLAPWLTAEPAEVLDRLEVHVKYAGYIERQSARAEGLAALEDVRVPGDLDLRGIPGLRAELAEKLLAVRPATLGQAGRIPGMTPAAIELLHVRLKARGGVTDE
jgi:tRNA uridine 5-carboxymethylaminomethyl modification enzyme